jgi:Holliday junction DNA helicase RuvB
VPTASSTGPTARTALKVYDVDELGLDRLDREVLDALVRRYGGGPVGLSTLAVAVSEEPETVEEVADPSCPLRPDRADARGRMATPRLAPPRLAPPDPSTCCRSTWGMPADRPVDTGGRGPRRPLLG